MELHVPTGCNLDRLVHGRENHLNLIRMVAAVGVILSHSYPLFYGVGTLEPLERWLGYSLGGASVRVFFALSGFLILKSFDRRKSLQEYVWSRMTRLIPALFIAAALTSLILGAALTEIQANRFFALRDPWTYPIAATSMFLSHDTLPGVFTHNQFHTVNGSLWTLRYEAICYIAVGLLGTGGVLRRKSLLGVSIVYSAIYALVQTGHISNSPLVFLSMPFLIGMILYRYRMEIPTSAGAVALVAGIGTLSIVSGRCTPIVTTICLAYLSLCLATIRLPTLFKYNRLGDYSYGTYLYAWPIQQTLLNFGLAKSAGHLFLNATAITIPIAVLSWHFVERVTLIHRHHIPDAVRLLRRRLFDVTPKILSD